MHNYFFHRNADKYELGFQRLSMPTSWGGGLGGSTLDIVENTFSHCFMISTGGGVRFLPMVMVSQRRNAASVLGFFQILAPYTQFATMHTT
jgi:hypothetical protein